MTPPDNDFDFGDEGGDSDDPFNDFNEDGDSGEDPFNFGKANPPPPAPARPVAPPPPPASSSAPARRTVTATEASSAKSVQLTASMGPQRNAAMASDVPVQVVAVMGKKHLTMRELIELKKGQVIELNRFPNEAIDLVANGRLMAKGELVEIEGKLGVRIIKIFE